jgi:glycosyltransferase involved in cell wall biosynthesis
MTDQVFAPGESAEHPYGVLYQGEYETEHDGTARAVRLHARALAGTGIPVLLKSFSYTVVTGDGVAEPVHNVGLTPRVVAETVNPLRFAQTEALNILAGKPDTIHHRGQTIDQPLPRAMLGKASMRNASIGELVPSIKHLVVRSDEQLQNAILPRGAIHHDPSTVLALRDAIYANTIVYSVWERDRVDTKVARQLSRVGQCWVPCEQNRQMLIASGVPATRVHVVPHPYEPTAMLCKLTRRKLTPAPKSFYSIGRWEPRKGYVQLIDAFAQAFGPSNGCTLTLKVTLRNWPDYPTPEQAIESASRRFGWDVGSAVKVITDTLSEDKILKLHFDNTVYVCSSHGEAWALPAFDAKVAGNALVHVPYGGTADFVDPEVDVAVPYTVTGLVPPSYGWSPDARWAEFRTEDLATALKHVALRREGNQVVFQRPPRFEERFSMSAVGATMRKLVLALVRETHPRAAEYLGRCGA